jgi:hypothetical protein
LLRAFSDWYLGSFIVIFSADALAPVVSWRLQGKGVQPSSAGYSDMKISNQRLLIAVR